MKSTRQNTYSPRRALRVGSTHLNILVAALIAVLASSQARADFSGPYAPANWTLNANGGDGSVDTSAAPISITLTGNNNDNGIETDTDYTITAVTAGTWSFDWAYDSTDAAGFDWSSYLVNGVETFLNGPSPDSGSTSILVNAGDVIGFRITSVDGGFGAGFITISNFSAPVPAPGALALLGIASLVGSRRRRS